ncbi:MULTISPECIES: DUF3060 domain-containing protein [unclassified Mycolicibacterium]|uniref:DUF3060 domain-containing protein n=1 Tax=unclassified Mycolicibacterium TaxID=2636767 RepID=UPI00192E7138|nr:MULTISPECIES: DUF3060 domain-containing protein [unclassified Mycolicibacterium]
MDPKDDPEARIRELERPFADAARASELGTDKHMSPAGPPPTQPWTYGNTFPPPPPPPPAPWPGYEQYPAPPQPRRSTGTATMFILFGVLAMMLVAGGIGAFLTFSNTESGNTGSGNDESFTDSQSTTTRETAVGRVPLAEPVAPTQVPAGETVIVSGISEHRTVECRDNTVIVSGVENEVEITGHCTAVTVSGVDNVITVDSVDTIGVSGFDNHVTYRSGEPEVTRSGQSNVVEAG